MENGDLQNGFTESDHVLEGEMRIGGQVRESMSNAYDLIRTVNGIARPAIRTGRKPIVYESYRW